MWTNVKIIQGLMLAIIYHCLEVKNTVCGVQRNLTQVYLQGELPYFTSHRHSCEDSWGLGKAPGTQ